MLKNSGGLENSGGLKNSGGRAPGLAFLFLTFLQLGMLGFGGVLPQTRRMLVERRGWLNEGEFTELLGLCQFLPGGNAINLSVAVGLRFRGIVGALCAQAGLLAAPAVILIALGTVYTRYAAIPLVRHVFAGIAAAAAGLLLSLAWRLLIPLWPRARPLLIAAATTLAIAAFRLPLLPTLLVMLPLSALLMRE